MASLEQGARVELAVLLFVEPCALDIKEPALKGIREKPSWRAPD
jgi:hypothetical protein